MAGAIVVLHPFAKIMGFNPHPHILVTEGGFDKQNNFIHQKYLVLTFSVVSNGSPHVCGNREHTPNFASLRLCDLALDQINAKTR